MPTPNYIVLKNNSFSDKGYSHVFNTVLDSDYKGSISEFATREIEKKNSILEVGDVIYELKPILKIHAVITASKIKSL